jgi:hypothetical protein
MRTRNYRRDRQKAEPEIVPDGGVVRVSLPMMDGMPREVHHSGQVFAAYGRPGVHAPGFCYAAPPPAIVADRSAARAARDAYVRRLGSAWGGTDAADNAPAANAEEARSQYVERLRNAWRQR